MAERSWRGGLRLLLGVGALSSAAPPALAQAVAGQVNRLSPYMEAIDATFRLDACGDGKTGGLLRRLIVEQAGKCPYGSVELNGFRAWVVSEDKRVAAQLKRYIAEHGHLPEHLDGMTMTCVQLRQSPDYLKMAARLAQYGQGKIGADDFGPRTCD